MDDANPMGTPKSAGSRTVLRALRKLILAAVSAWLVYLVLGNALLMLEPGRALFERPGKSFDLRFAHGYTVVPGRVALRDIELYGHNRRFTWSAKLDSARGQIVLPSLFQRQVRWSWLVGDGLLLQLDRQDELPGAETADDGSTTILRSSLASIAIPTATTKQPWTFAAHDMTLENLRQLCYAATCWQGEGSFSGDLLVEPRGLIAASSTRLQLERGVLRDDRAAIAEAFELDVELDVEPFRPRDNRGAKAWSFVSGRLQISGRVADLDWLSYAVRGVPWLSFDGAGQLSADLWLRRGRLLTPSRLEVADGELGVSFLADQARGRGRVELQVAEVVDATATTANARGSAPRATGTLRLVLDSFDVTRRGLEAPHIRGENFTVEVTATDLDLADPTPDLAVTVDLPRSELLRFDLYNAYLPPATGLEILGGHGDIRFHFAATTGDSTGEGEIVLNGRDVRGRYKKQKLSGDLSLETELQLRDLAQGHFELTSGRLELDHVAVGSTARRGDWWARLELHGGLLDLRPPLALRSSFVATLRDTGPLFYLLVGQPPHRWLESLVTIDGVEGQGEIEITDQAIYARRVVVTGPQLDILANLRLVDQRAEGVLYAAYGPFAAAVAVDEKGRRDWAVWRPRPWFLERSAGLRWVGSGR